jgi:type VI protein secretion system component VasK
VPNFTFGDPYTLTIALVLCLAVGILWVFQFVKLMSLADEDFPGQHARLGWVAGFVLLWFITPFAFLIWNAGRRSASRPRSSRRRGAD